LGSTFASARIVTLLVGIAVLAAGCSGVSAPTTGSDRPGDDHTATRETHTGGRQTGPPRDAARGQRVVDLAMKHIGTPYRWGSAGPSGFDCSGFVMYVNAQVGVVLPHNAAMQYQYGTPVPRERLEPGDLVFFDGLRHNGIYVGQGRFIHARQTGRRVGVAALDEDWYRTRWVGARRL
jgi:cell wall-associated NlpC family hydrolase